MFIDDLAAAVQQHEGWYPGSRSFRNNNPGNLRNGGKTDSGKFTIYPSYVTGFAALKYDLTVKCTNKSKPMASHFKKKGIRYEQAPFLCLFEVYAPSSDNNSPTSYCADVCKQLRKKGHEIFPTTPLSSVGNMINGITEYKPPVIDVAARVKGLQRRIVNTRLPEVKALIGRVLERLKNRL